MELNTMTAKNVRWEIKRGNGFDDLCKKYNCNADSLERRLRTLFSHDGDKIIADLREISRKKNRRMVRKESRCNNPVIPPPRGPS